MRIPKRAPGWQSILAAVHPTRLITILNVVSAENDAPTSTYLHWDDISRREPPAGISPEEWWFAVKYGRMQVYKTVPLTDSTGDEFRYVVTDSILEQLHRIDLGAGGRTGLPAQIVSRESREQYAVSTLMEEAASSCQLDGAAMERASAKDMLRERRTPIDRGERMIINTYAVLQRVIADSPKQLTPELVLDLHRQLTSDTLDDPSGAGRPRRINGDVRIADLPGDVTHQPPPASELIDRLETMCRFANGEEPDEFVHPVVRAMILHFWLAYEHPFVDGNGRLARALFYWCMLNNGYRQCEFLSISDIILKAPQIYAREFLYTETDDNDLTYFLLYHVNVLRLAMQALADYVKKKEQRLTDVEASLSTDSPLNYRQRSLLSHAVRHPGFHYTTEGHRASHDISYNPARVDLMDLAKRGLLDSTKAGKTTYFIAPRDLSERL